MLASCWWWWWWCVIGERVTGGVLGINAGKGACLRRGGGSNEPDSAYDEAAANNRGFCIEKCVIYSRDAVVSSEYSLEFGDVEITRDRSESTSADDRTLDQYGVCGNTAAVRWRHCVHYSCHPRSPENSNSSVIAYVRPSNV